MGQLFSDLFTKNHFVMPTDMIMRPLLIMLGILIAVLFLLCCAPKLCGSASNRGANEALSAQQNGEAGAIPLQNASEFQQNHANANPGNSTDAPHVNPSEFRDINPEPPSYSNSIAINDDVDDISNSDCATIRPRTESSCRLSRFIGPTLCSGRSNISGPLNVSTLKEKKVRYANQQSVVGPSNVRQSSFDLYGGDELNAEELNYDLFRNRSKTVVMGNSSPCGESKVNVAYVSEITADKPIIPPVDYEEPSIPPVDYNEEPHIPPIDYSSDESTINVERLSRSDYVVDGASEGSEDLNLRTVGNEDKLDDAIEEAIGSLDEVLEAASLQTPLIQFPKDKVMNNTYGGVKIIKMIPKK